ncbi:MAG: DUF1800 family protein [Alphaproteobacteria bacterium]
MTTAAQTPVAQGQPALSLSDAGRFLRRASFGPSYADLTHLQEIGIERWFAEQFTAPRIDRHGDYILRGGPIGRRNGRQKPRRTFYETFYYQAAFGQDQLRQRMAYALSQIFVVSAEDPQLKIATHALGHYMDLLTDNALGNFRTLLGHVATSPAMGEYLTFLRNRKENMQTGRQPDENFAREIMQLFTIGLWELHPNGQFKQDASGYLIPTYGQDEIRGMARVFTGWSWGGGPRTKAFWRGGGSPNGVKGRPWDKPLNYWPDEHEFGAKDIVSGVQIPAGSNALDSLNRALDVLFNHPNTAPFICRQLIQRLVTSNPSPDYIYRVAQVFADNGHGVRGDLSAVAVAILLDPEAWWPAGQVQTAGKLREPVLRLAQFLRTFGELGMFEAQDLGAAFAKIAKALGQHPFEAPSVFNWYTPDFAPPGEIADAGLAAPEFKLYDDGHVMGYADVVVKVVHRGVELYQDWHSAQPRTYPSLGDLPADPDRFVVLLNQLLCANTLSADRIAIIRDALAALPDTAREERIWTGLALTMVSPEYMVEI